MLAGITVFERQAYWIAQALEAIAKEINPASPRDVELHGNPMLQGNKGWKTWRLDDRIRWMTSALNCLAVRQELNRCFAVVIEKESVKAGDPVEFAFEQLCNRFDRFLHRLYLADNTQRGLLVLDRSSNEKTFQGLAVDFWTIGHRWGVLRNIAEVPLFVDSKASRLVQLADLVAYAVFRKYEKGDDRFFKVIQSRFDREGGQVHGLVHWTVR